MWSSADSEVDGPYTGRKSDLQPAKKLRFTLRTVSKCHEFLKREEQWSFMLTKKIKSESL